MRTPDEREGDCRRRWRRTASASGACSRPSRVTAAGPWPGTPRRCRTTPSACCGRRSREIPAVSTARGRDRRRRVRSRSDSDPGRDPIAGDEAEVDFTGSRPRSRAASMPTTRSPWPRCCTCSGAGARRRLDNAGDRAPDSHRRARRNDRQRAAPRRRWPAATSRPRSASSTSCSGSGKGAPDRIPAASQGTMNNVALGGVDLRPVAGSRTTRPSAAARAAAGQRRDLGRAHPHEQHVEHAGRSSRNAPAPARREYAVRRGAGGWGSTRAATVWCGRSSCSRTRRSTS